MTKPMTSEILAVPKVELHVHIEGTVTPDKCRELAAKNGIALDDALFSADGSAYQYSDFIDCVTRVYFGVAATIKNKSDYADITYDYLKRCAAENTLYVELIACPSQAVRSNIDYKDMIDGMADGINRARADFGIESRINVTFERNAFVTEAEVAATAERDADMILSYQHPYIVGLDIAGGEKKGDIPPFRAAYNRVLTDFGRRLGVRMHASENADAGNASEALTFGVSRIGHGVQVVLNPAVIKRLRGQDEHDMGVMLEVCPTSNILALKDFSPTYADHPLRKLYDLGLHISLNSDDPGLFDTSIGREYQIAHDEFNFTPQELFDVTRSAILFSFAPPDIRQGLYEKLEQVRPNFFSTPRIKSPGMQPQ